MLRQSQAIRLLLPFCGATTHSLFIKLIHVAFFKGSPDQCRGRSEAASLGFCDGRLYAKYRHVRVLRQCMLPQAE